MNLSLHNDSNDQVSINAAMLAMWVSSFHRRKLCQRVKR
jgi:hypothetical protein